MSPRPRRTASLHAKTRRSPERMCVVCRSRRGKRELVRVVRGRDHVLSVDDTGKSPGRGAYLCRSRECWTSPGLADRIAQGLKTTLTQNDRSWLEAVARELPENADSG